MAFDIRAAQEAIRSSTCIRPAGAGTKFGRPATDPAAVDMTQASGVIDYQPTEFVITAWAGTPVAEVQSLLAEHGQYLPFDPLLVERGATLGGTIAANACGPERYRYGGVRDFLIGTRFIDGNGELIQGGGKVVKNAAGFDYPKLLVGSRGRLGIIVDATFKVFPKPEAYATLQVHLPELTRALDLLPRLTNCPYDINAIDIVASPPDRGVTLLVRVGGLEAGLPQRMARIRALCGDGDVITGQAEMEIWRTAREFTWIAADECVVKVPLTPSDIPALDACVREVKRRYSVGGNVAWLAAARHHDFDAALRALGLPGLTLLGSADGDPRIGAHADNPFADRVKRALDPLNKFGDHGAHAA